MMDASRHPRPSSRSARLCVGVFVSVPHRVRGAAAGGVRRPRCRCAAVFVAAMHGLRGGAWRADRLLVYPPPPGSRFCSFRRFRHDDAVPWPTYAPRAMPPVGVPPRWGGRPLVFAGVSSGCRRSARSTPTPPPRPPSLPRGHTRAAAAKHLARHSPARALAVPATRVCVCVCAPRRPAPPPARGAGGGGDGCGGGRDGNGNSGGRSDGGYVGPTGHRGGERSGHAGGQWSGRRGAPSVWRDGRG